MSLVIDVNNASYMDPFDSLKCKATFNVILFYITI